MHTAARRAAPQAAAGARAAARAARLQVDLVGADAEAANAEQAPRAGERLGAHARLAADAQHVHFAQARRQLSRRQRCRHGLLPGAHCFDDRLFPPGPDDARLAFTSLSTCRKVSCKPCRPLVAQIVFHAALGWFLTQCAAALGRKWSKQNCRCALLQGSPAHHVKALCPEYVDGGAADALQQQDLYLAHREGSGAAAIGIPACFQRAHRIHGRQHHCERLLAQLTWPGAAGLCPFPGFWHCSRQSAGTGPWYEKAATKTHLACNTETKLATALLRLLRLLRLPLLWLGGFFRVREGPTIKRGNWLPVHGPGKENCYLKERLSHLRR